MKRLLPLLLILTVTNFARSQNKKIDSLIHIADGYKKEDTTRFNLLGKISFDFWNNDVQDSAIIYSDSALSLAKKLNYIKGIGQAYNNLGLIYSQKDNYPEALKNYLKALKIFEASRIRLISAT